MHNSNPHLIDTIEYNDINLHGRNICYNEDYNQLYGLFPHYSNNESGYVNSRKYELPQPNVYLNSFSNNATLNVLNAIKGQSQDYLSNNEVYGVSTCSNKLFQHSFNLNCYFNNVKSASSSYQGQSQDDMLYDGRYLAITSSKSIFSVPSASESSL